MVGSNHINFKGIINCLLKVTGEIQGLPKEIHGWNICDALGLWYPGATIIERW